jgi:G3E family GTPase
MRVNLLFGFLGSGKTTLAQRLLKEGGGGRKMAVIVNEFGDVGIDGEILEGADIDMVELTSGCLCCTLKGPLLNAIEELNAKKDIDITIIEATGIAEPEEMIEMFSDEKFRGRYEVGPMITVVDVHKFVQLLEMLGPFYEAQIRNADVLVLNKIDLASADDLDTVCAAIVVINGEAELIFTEHCELETEKILANVTSAKMISHLATNHDVKTNTEEVHEHNHAHRHASALSFVLDSSGNAWRADIKKFFDKLPGNVWRVKGFAHVDGAPALIQFTMGQLVITTTEERAHYHTVFIGPDIDRSKIEPAFVALFASKVFV